MNCTCMERYDPLLSFDVQLNVHNSCTTELEQQVVLLDFHLHEHVTTLSELLSFYGNLLIQIEIIALISKLSCSFHMTLHA